MWVDESHKGKAVATVEERAYFSNVVVRARLRSAADGVLRFGNGNYLKGTGSASFHSEGQHYGTGHSMGRSGRHSVPETADWRE